MGIVKTFQKHVENGYKKFEKIGIHYVICL